MDPRVLNHAVITGKMNEARKGDAALRTRMAGEPFGSCFPVEETYCTVLGEVADVQRLPGFLLHF